MKGPNLAENLTNLAENLFFKLKSAKFIEIVFFKSDMIFLNPIGKHKPKNRKFWFLRPSFTFTDQKVYFGLKGFAP